MFETICSSGIILICTFLGLYIGWKAGLNQINIAPNLHQPIPKCPHELCSNYHKKCGVCCSQIREDKYIIKS
jgi:hypothetical protein